MTNEELNKLLHEALFHMGHASTCRFSSPYKYRTSFDACICGTSDVMDRVSKAINDLEQGKFNVH